MLSGNNPNYFDTMMTTTFTNKLTQKKYIFSTV